MKKINKFICLLLFTAIFSTMACDNAAFREQIGEFQAAMNDSRASLESYYVEMNQFEKELYLLRRELDANEVLGAEFTSDRKPEEKFTFNDKVLYIEGPFPPEAIQARMDAMKLIGLYGNRLAELAGTESPVIFENETAALGENIVNLAATFNKLSATGADETAAKFIAPIGKLVGMVGRLFLERKRDKELIAAIREATPQITLITTQLESDFNKVLIDKKDTGMRATISLLVLNYNKMRAKSDRKTRRELLAEINGVVRSYELFKKANPAEIAQSMEEANQALLAYANSGRKDEDFTQLVARIGEFRDFAKKAANAILEIRDIRRELRNAD
jgi:hypothetical protein